MDSVWPAKVQLAIEVADDHIITAADPLPATSGQLFAKINGVRRGAH